MPGPVPGQDPLAQGIVESPEEELGTADNRDVLGSIRTGDPELHGPEARGREPA